jgi:GNAT superfamily N-acetyltransferase
MRLENVGGHRVDEIVDLVLRCDEEWRPWAPAGWEPPERERERVGWLDRMRGGRHWIRAALDGDQLVGIVAWRRVLDDEGKPAREPVGHIDMLFVEPSEWGRGIGRDMLVAAEQAMRKAGCAVGRLNVAERNPARSFYERHGWSVAGPAEFSPGLQLPLVPYEKRF